MVAGEEEEKMTEEQKEDKGEEAEVAAEPEIEGLKIIDVTMPSNRSFTLSIMFFHRPFLR